MKPHGTSPLSSSLMPITAHSATSGCDGQHLLHAAGREPVAGDVDDVVGAAHDEDVAVLVLEAGVGGFVVAGEFGEVAFAHALVGLPQRRQARRRQRQLDHDRAHRVGRDLLARLVDDAHVVARHRHRRRAVLDRQHAEADRVAGDRPAGLGLPPMIDHRHLEQLLRPYDACRDRRARRRGTACGISTGRIARRSLPCGSSFLMARNAVGAVNMRDAAVLGDHAPERAGVRRADRLALVEDRGAAVQQRRVDDVAVADHPADVGGRPVHLAGLDAVEILHRPFERDHVAAIVAHHALGPAGRARGVEDIERIGGRDRHAIAGRARVHERVIAHRRPVVVAAGDQRRLAPAAAAGSGRRRACAATSAIASSSSGL